MEMREITMAIPSTHVAISLAKEDVEALRAALSIFVDEADAMGNFFASDRGVQLVALLDEVQENCWPHDDDCRDDYLPWALEELEE